MDPADTVRMAPARVTWGSAPGVTSPRLDGLVAEHDRAPGSAATGAHAVLDGGRVAVWPLPPPPTTGRLGPVYGVGSQIAVPTGRVLVRFADGIEAGTRRDAIEGARYRIESVPGYAPQAAWVRAATGDIVEALRRLDRLAALPDVVHVDPEMLLPRRKR